MANQTSDQFGYDFEHPIAEIESRIAALRERTAEGDAGCDGEIEALEQERMRVIEEVFAKLTPYQRVKLARHPLRPQPLDYAHRIMNGFLELHGDRLFGDDRAIITAVGRMEKHRVLLVAHQKGKETKEKIRCNFGMAGPEGYRKALRKMRLAEKFGLPILCMIDTPGAAPTDEAEMRGVASSIAENIFHMAALRVPIVVVTTGEGCSGGALGIGVGDRFAMCENAYYAVITPEGCAAILWKDGNKAEEAAAAMKLTAADMLDLNVIDQIVKEPSGGAHRNPDAAAELLKEYLVRTLDELTQIPLGTLLERRYERFRALGDMIC